MSCYSGDKRIVLTLDAGGTNLVFSAIQGCKEIVEPIAMPSNAHDLQLCLSGIIDGFTRVKSQLKEEPVAISFAFPGPSDYPNGVIGDLGNLPAFRGGVALGAMLEEIFGVPVFINNDGDLYAYGEAIVGYLPWVNEQLKQGGSPKRFKNIVGLTLGTGFGGGIVRDGQLFMGDNSAAAEVWLMSNVIDPSKNIEELISIRAVRRDYAETVGLSLDHAPHPKDICDIATGKMEGNKDAAIAAFSKMGRALGDAISNLLTVIDGIAVIGGGVSGAKELFMPSMMEVMRSRFSGVDNPRLSQKVYNLECESDLKDFVKGDAREVQVPFSNKTVCYDAAPRVAVGISRIGASSAISMGAYAYALSKL